MTDNVTLDQAIKAGSPEQILDAVFAAVVNARDTEGLGNQYVDPNKYIALVNVLGAKRHVIIDAVKANRETLVLDPDGNIPGKDGQPGEKPYVLAAPTVTNTDPNFKPQLAWNTPVPDSEPGKATVTYPPKPPVPAQDVSGKPSASSPGFPSDTQRPAAPKPATNPASDGSVPGKPDVGSSYVPTTQPPASSKPVTNF